MYGMRSQVILHPRRESQLRSYLWSTLLVALVLGCSSKVVPGPDSSAVVDLAEPPLEPMDKNRIRGDAQAGRAGAESRSSCGQGLGVVNPAVVR